MQTRTTRDFSSHRSGELSYPSLTATEHLYGLDLEVEADEREHETLEVLYQVVEAPQTVCVPETRRWGLRYIFTTHTQAVMSWPVFTV